MRIHQLAKPVYIRAADCALPHTYAEDEEKEEEEMNFMERMLLSKGSNLAVAFICSKILVPVKLPVALALTPYVQR